MIDRHIAPVTLKTKYARSPPTASQASTPHATPSALDVEPGRIHVDHGLTGPNRDRHRAQGSYGRCSAGDVLAVAEARGLALASPGS